MELVKKQASFKGYTALGAVALTTTLIFNGWWLTGLLGVGASTWLVKRWFSYRAKWGLRF
jgi:hypothetical protein